MKYVHFYKQCKNMKVLMTKYAKQFDLFELFWWKSYETN